MKMEASDPDVATIVSRIHTGDLDLQPDFQRGEVWPTSKKQRLIDSILRGWHVPPIHVIEVEETATEEVLDGQQRLAAIRDFVNGEMVVNGRFAPDDETIMSLHGQTYAMLPDAARRRFDKFSIRFFRITDYEPEEPGELFFRLNQPVRLTAAEQRNAFYGPVRKQIKELVDYMDNLGFNKALIGFSNSRMSYDEVIARLCVAIENKTIAEKITARKLTVRYRSADPFESLTTEYCRKAIEMLAKAIEIVDEPVRFNKATFFSWLWFFTEINHSQINCEIDKLGTFLRDFEKIISVIHSSQNISGTCLFGEFRISPEVARQLMQLYHDRSSSRVTDVMSVQLRDMTIWIFFVSFLGSDIEMHISESKKFSSLKDTFLEFYKEQGAMHVIDLPVYIIKKYGWGEL